ncbi:hypothetical protein [Lacticaseibacillus absianus]|uniref:hypothetical protein n=1 Tax=Lacticaseibacillus absianus TaxID=2729623 RepID=UPI0015C9F14F|nr:hypothetical protein [Lacticaseibacillus absianus]
MTSDPFDRLIARLSAVNERIRQLEDVDTPTAMAKGYSASGATLAEVTADLAAAEKHRDRLQAQLDRWHDHN